MEDVKRNIFSYVELFYNRKRMHFALGYLARLHTEESIRAEKLLKVRVFYAYGFALPYELFSAQSILHGPLMLH